MLKSFGKILKGSKKGSPNAEFDDLESVLKSTHGCRKRARNHSGESKGVEYDEFEYGDVYEGSNENCNSINIFKSDLSSSKKKENCDPVSKKVTVKVQRANKGTGEYKEESKDECKEQSMHDESKYNEDDRSRNEEKEGWEESKNSSSPSSSSSSAFDKPVKRRGSFGAIILSPIKNVVVTSNDRPAAIDKKSSKTEDILTKKKRRKSTEANNDSDLGALYEVNESREPCTLKAREAPVASRASEGTYTGMSANEFFSKVRHNHYDTVKANVKSFDLTLRDEKGNTALIVACQNNHKRLAALLVDNGCDLNAVNKKGLTALDTADLFKFINLAQYLVLQGAENATSDSMTNYSQPKYMATADLKSFR